MAAAGTATARSRAVSLFTKSSPRMRLNHLWKVCLRGWQCDTDTAVDLRAILPIIDWVSLGRELMAPFNIEVLATPEAVSDLNDKVLIFLREQQVDTRAAHHVAMAVEELVVNLGTHGNCRHHPARIKLVVEATQVKAEIADTGPPFDPRRIADPNLDAPLEDRPIGGLGLYLVRQLSRTFDYKRRKGRNVTTFSIARS
jgi:serine/threonine-protein kinase RsbW